MEIGHAGQHPPRKRRRLSGEKKYLVLEEVKAHPERKGEILRREGLFQADLKRSLPAFSWVAPTYCV